MILSERIFSELAGLVGYRSSFDKEDTIDTDIQASESGLLVNGVHALINSGNLLATLADGPQNFIAFTAYDLQTTFAKGTIVKSGDKLYTSLQDNNQSHPVSDDTWWKPTSLLSQVLRRTYRDAVTTVLNSFLDTKKEAGAGKELLSSGMLLNENGRLPDQIEKNGRFVGFLIRPRETDLAVVLRRVGVQFSANGTIPIKIYRITSDEPLQSIPVNYQHQGKFFYDSLSSPVSLPYWSENVMGETYLVGYDENDLPEEARAVRVAHTIGKGNCWGCNPAYATIVGKWSPYVEVKAISAPANALGDEEGYTYHTDTNFGLNLVFDVVCDVTERVIQQRNIFARAIQLQWAIGLLEIMAASTRVNQAGNVAEVKAYNYLYEFQNPQNPHTLLKQAMKSLNLDLSDLNETCLPCKDANTGIEIGAW
ncbi:hypothetical protein BWI97_15730 [Siphonobacter sp. BAB-5405]|uniref:hypothetical protein n=1 Tax=Siphonobacter sp. BAB-5405 TaxID=1864825 RepID=UPI000C807142|nr:hypothetical protein [Siphonobacter sp. BAB-5405]PMD94846.1 hypothetical protein BWI97_15730 [Siphonobacter sp. BAB-5405]